MIPLQFAGAKSSTPRTSCRRPRRRMHPSPAHRRSLPDRLAARPETAEANDDLAGWYWADFGDLHPVAQSIFEMPSSVVAAPARNWKYFCPVVDPRRRCRWCWRQLLAMKRPEETVEGPPHRRRSSNRLVARIRVARVAVASATWPVMKSYPASTRPSRSGCGRMPVSTTATTIAEERLRGLMLRR
jgi:hypothetical protein